MTAEEFLEEQNKTANIDPRVSTVTIRYVKHKWEMWLNIIAVALLVVTYFTYHGSGWIEKNIQGNFLLYSLLICLSVWSLIIVAQGLSFISITLFLASLLSYYSLGLTEQITLKTLVLLSLKVFLFAVAFIIMVSDFPKGISKKIISLITLLLSASFIIGSTAIETTIIAVSIPLIASKLKEIWHYDTDTKLAERTLGEKYRIRWLSLISLMLLISSFVLYYGLEWVDFEVHKGLIIGGLLVYAYVIISGVVLGDSIGGSIRANWLWALGCQPLYTILYDTTELNPLLFIVISTLIIKFGLRYFGVAVLFIWMLSVYTETNFIVSVLICVIPLLYAWGIRKQVQSRKEHKEEKIYEKELKGKYLIQVYKWYLLLLVFGQVYYYGF